MNQSPPQPQSILLGPSRIFSKIRGDIRKSRCTHRFERHRWQIFKKIWNGPNGILRGFGQTNLMKNNRSRKSRDTVSLTSAYLVPSPHTDTDCWYRKTFKVITLKGQCHEIFCFWFFSWISPPPAPEYPIRTVTNFFENSRRHSQIKVHPPFWTTPVADFQKKLKRP